MQENKLFNKDIHKLHLIFEQMKKGELKGNNINDILYDYHTNIVFDKFIILLVDPLNGDIIDANEKACEFYGYNKSELIEKNIAYLDVADNKKILDILQECLETRSNALYFKHRIATQEIKYIKMYAGPINKNNKSFIYCIIEDITDSTKLNKKFINYSKLLENILAGIPDIIGVYNVDRTIMFYNLAGYNFYEKERKEVNGKKCYQMLGRTKRCDDCDIEVAIRNKTIIRKERYIKEIDKHVDCCWNPVLDDYGNVMFVVEQLRDITDKKALENILSQNEENYCHFINLLSDVVIISVNGIIVSANEQVFKYCDDVLGKYLYEFVPDNKDIVIERLKQLQENKGVKSRSDYKVTIDNIAFYFEVASSYVNYKGKPAVVSFFRDISKRKKELNAAAKVQRKELQKDFPLKDKLKIEYLYFPAKTVSGDFFYFYKVNNDLLIGILGDVSGKGITAALNISAFNVLFHEAVLQSQDPLKIVEILNKKIGNYLDEKYVAVCCFSFNFKTNNVKIVSAGINHFITLKKNNQFCEEVIKGPFLGMFDNSKFGEMKIDFEKGDRFYFLSDGLDFIFDNKTIKENLEKFTLLEFKNYFNTYLKGIELNINGLKDDSTLIGIEIK
ncbi:MAG: PAS domain S-box protein [Vallitalea sp.]|jgi:PAS domain S-box-containing protein|nr:PAS domain S-box protein [Vallitalea sp.]